MDLCYDLEFLEDGRTIELISIGMVADDGREYYAVASDAPWERIKQNDWLVRNVVPHLPVTGRTALDTYLKAPPTAYPRTPLEVLGLDLTDSCVKPKFVIANEVRDFIQATDAIEPALWADYGAYDHVCLAQLWGSMMRLPPGVPMWTHDLRQEIERLGIADADLPQQTEGVHNALADARHVRTVRRWLAEQEEKRTS
jgi:3' exoribonuclease, RNase T-like